MAARASVRAVARARSLSWAVSAFGLGQTQRVLDLGQLHRGRPLLLLGLAALGLEHRGLAVQAQPRFVGHPQVVLDRHQVLLEAVDALLEAAGLRFRRLGGGRLLGHPAAGELQQGLGRDVALGHLARLAPRGQEALHPAAAFDHRAAGGLAGQGDAGHGTLAPDDVERVLEALHHEGVGQRGLDPLGMGSRDPEEVGQKALDLWLLGRDLAQGTAVGLGARLGQGQEGAAPGSRLLQIADAAEGLGRVGHEHGLEAVADERLHRALVGLVGLESVGHDALHVEALRTVEQGAHALVEGGVRPHHLLERGQAADQARDLGLQASRPRARGPRRGGALRPRAPGPSHARPEAQALLGREALRLRGLTAFPRRRALALQLVPLRGELQQVGLGALRAAGDRAAGVLEGGDAAHEADLRVAGLLLPRSASACRAVLSRGAPSAAFDSSSAATSSLRSDASSPRRASRPEERGPTRAVSSSASRRASSPRVSVSAICCLS